MQLGDMLNRFDDPAFAREAVLALGELSLLAELGRRAASIGLDLGHYATSAVRRYASQASDEEWITLMGAMNRATDPGAIYLRRALEWDRKTSEC